LGREAYSVLAAVGGSEGETTLGGAPLGDDTVVVVEDFVDGDGDADGLVGDVGAGGVGVLLGAVVA